MILIFRCCEKQGSISTTPRWEEQPKSLIMRKSFASLLPSMTKDDKLILLHDAVTADNLFAMRESANCETELIPVSDHPWEYNLHTIKLIELVEELTKIHGPDEQIFMIEDDYLFTPDALTRLRLTFPHFGDCFFVPYDYPDRYRPGAIESSFILAGPTNHWRTVSSSTMTVCGPAKLWQHFLTPLKKAAPTSDDKVFTEIYKQVYCLAPLPGFAAHLTPFHLSPYTDWKALWNNINI